MEYQFAHDRPLNVGATAQLLSNTLYYKRFFPYYTANLCVGLDPQGETPVLISCLHNILYSFSSSSLTHGRWHVRRLHTICPADAKCCQHGLCRAGCGVHL